ncbi:MAG: fumarylacetoacetate hydrolase family protein [Cryomorphaceae bacterium]
MDANSIVQQVADLLWEQLSSGQTCAPVRLLIGETDIRAAYEAQHINTKRREQRGESIVGAKIGLTSFAVQKQLGVDQPDYGMLTDKMQVFEGHAIPWNELFQPKAEMEMGFILKKDIDGMDITMEVLEDAIEAVVPSIEIVGSRISDWNIRITDTIADNASASHFIIGDPIKNWKEIDLAACSMQMTRAGKVVSEGTSAACMGNPLNATLWLAKTMADLGTPLRAGYIILSGALGPLVNVEPGDIIEGSIEGIGSINVSFGIADEKG